MSQVTEIMKRHLEKKGIQPIVIPGFVRDLINTISINPQSTIQELDAKLHFLGWDDFELDEYTLELVIASFEAGGFSKQGTI